MIICLHRVLLAIAFLALAACIATASVWAFVWAGDPYPRTAAPHRPTGLEAALIETQASGPGDTFVVLYTGDNGWRQGDRGFAHQLAGLGYPTVAIDSLRNFSRAPSHARPARELSAIIEHYAHVWGRPRVVLAGYSFGADALVQFMPLLTPGARARVVGVALIAPGLKGDLTLHPYTLFDIDRPGAPATAAALAGFGAIPVICVYARDDPGAACPTFPRGLVALRLMAGGHRFKGHFPAVAQAIAAMATQKSPSAQPPSMTARGRATAKAW